MMAGIDWVDYAATLLLLLPAIAIGERLAPERRPESHPPRPSQLRWFRRREDLAWLGLVLVVVPGVAGATAAIGTALAHRGALAPLLLRRPLAAAIIGAGVAELAAYWVHRAEHLVGVLWRIHRPHHRPTHVDVLSGLRSHPLDVVAVRALPVLAAAAVGVTPAELSAYLAVLFVVTMFAHADLDIADGWLSYVVVTPGYHRTHHERRHNNANFASVLPALDRLFGTAAVAAEARDFGPTGPTHLTATAAGPRPTTSRWRPG